MVAMEGCGLTRAAGRLSMLVGIFVHFGRYISYIKYDVILCNMIGIII